MATLRQFALTPLAAIVITALLALGGSSVLAAGPPSGLAVTVINDATMPVPVSLQGTGSITGSVNVTNNPLNVSVTNSALPVSGSVTVGNAATSPVPVQTVAPSPLTHMGQNASNHVVLDCDTAPCVRMLPDGSTTAFSLPSGHVLIITDVSWQGDGVSAGDLQTIVLSTKDQNGPYVWFGGAIGDGQGIISKSEHLTGGIVFSGVPAAFTAGGHSRFIRLFGYLTADS